MPKTKNQNYSMYEIITMTPGKAGEVLFNELNKDNPDLELVKNILDHSIVHVNLRYYGSTVLMKASLYGRTEIVKLLLKTPEIDVNVQDGDGVTALMWASDQGRNEIVQMLLERPEILVNVQNRWGHTALMRASEGGHTEIVRMLLEHPKIDVNLKNEDGNTALMKAYNRGHREIVRMLDLIPM